MYNNPKKIYLLGFMGSGKTTIGKHLASSLGFKFIDLDDYIEELEEQTISDLFENEGEAYFRILETQALKDLLYQNNVVISLGGGTPCFYDNMTLINNTGTSIYLKVSIDKIIERLRNETTHRPILAHAKTQEELESEISHKLSLRKDFYEQAHFTIDADQEVEMISSNIIGQLNS